MPELPEVQAVVDNLKNNIIGEEIISITPLWDKTIKNFNPKKNFNKNSPKKIIDITRRAKFIILHFSDFILAIHLRMTGKFYLSNNKIIPIHTRVVFDLTSSKQLIFEDIRKFGRIYLYKNLETINKAHGPEPLGKYFTPKWLIHNLKNKKRMIKSLLLDQSFLAGLGNIYVDECLWDSGIHPISKSNKIPYNRMKNLHESIQTILKKAIEHKGTTIINFSYQQNKQTGNYASKLNIFGKNKEPCPKCRKQINKLKIAGRGTYICNYCQKIFR